MPPKDKKTMIGDGDSGAASVQHCSPPLAINGFRDDVSVLLSAFLQKNTFRFQSFVEVWEEMKFGFIYGGIATTRSGLTELHEFAEKCYREAVILCLPPNESLNRVAGLYLLYCLYISRPYHCHAKVRIHPKTEMAVIVGFMEELVKCMHYDTVYCFLELYEQNAFCYTLTAREMGSHTQRSKAWRDDSSIRMYIPDIPKLLTSEIISKILDADSLYAQTKSQLLDDPEQCTNNGLEPSQFDYVAGDLRSRLQLISDEYMKTMQNLYQTHHSDQQQTQPDINVDNGEDSIGQRRQQLRQQQMTRSVKERGT